MKMFFITDNKGNKSVTMTILWIGFVVCTFKLLVSGMDWGQGWKFSDFSGADYGLALGALGALYQSTKVIRNKYPGGDHNDSETVK